MTDHAEALAKALEIARDALARCYDVTEWPADGTSQQDSAIQTIEMALAAYRSRATAAEAAIARLRDEVIEECANLIDKSQIADTSAGQVVDPRSEGNRSGLAYADALRALKSNQEPQE